MKKIVPQELLQVRAMHTKFGIDYQGPVRHLSAEEKAFRVAAMQEELNEYRDATTLEEEFDALIDLAVFTNGTVERQGMMGIYAEGYYRVMQSNMAKELTGKGLAKRGGFSLDLSKPEGWTGPDHSDLIKWSGQPKGLIILEGPDGSGKTSIGEYLQDHFGAEYIHCTWSEELEYYMDSYIIGTLVRAKHLAKEKLVVVDRSFLSEKIYSKVFRDGTKYPELESKCFELLEDALIVMCLPDSDKWINLYAHLAENRSEMYGNKLTEMGQVYSEYLTEYKDTYSQFYNVIRYDMFEYDMYNKRPEVIRVLNSLYELKNL